MLVGTPAYDDPALPDVPVVANNIADFASVLTDPSLGGFDATHCTVAPRRTDVAQIGDLLMQAAAEAEDLLLFYYSGHGLLGTRQRELYLSLAGTRHDRPAFTALSFDSVRDACLESRARSRVVILDSCFSGRAIGETLAGTDEAVLGQIEVTGTYTLTSAPANRTALILPGEEHTAFTGRMLALLRNGSPEAGPLLSLGDVYRHLHTRLRAEGLPVPQQRGTETADLLGLVRNRHEVITPVANAPLPDRSDMAPAAGVRLREQAPEAKGIDNAGKHAGAAREHRRPLGDSEHITRSEEPSTLQARSPMAGSIGASDGAAQTVQLLRSLVPEVARALGADDGQTLDTRHLQMAWDAVQAIQHKQTSAPDTYIWVPDGKCWYWPTVPLEA